MKELSFLTVLFPLATSHLVTTAVPQFEGNLLTLLHSCAEIVSTEAQRKFLNRTAVPMSQNSLSPLLFKQNPQETEGAVLMFLHFLALPSSLWQILASSVPHLALRSEKRSKIFLATPKGRASTHLGWVLSSLLSQCCLKASI